MDQGWINKDKLKLYKAAGVDGISAEILKNEGKSGRMDVPDI